MNTRKSIFACFAVVFLFVGMFYGCDLFTSYEYTPPSGFIQFVSDFPVSSSTDPVNASYCYGDGYIYVDVEDGATLSLRVASSTTDYISSTSPGTVMSNSNSFELQYGNYSLVAFCYWGKNSTTGSYSPSQCKRGVVNVNPNASDAPYFEYADSRVLGSVNVPQLGKVKIKATNSGATVYGIWKYGANSSNIPTSSEWDSCIFSAQNELEMPLDFMGATYGTLFAREKDVGKDRSVDNTMITVYRNDSVSASTTYTFALTFTQTSSTPVLGQMTYYIYLTKLSSASSTADGTGVYQNQNVSSVTISDGYYNFNAKSDALGWAALNNGSPNFTVNLGSITLNSFTTDKYGNKNLSFTVKNGVPYNGIVQ